ncbi:MAG: hypothetical protein ACHQ0J_16010 [Candidatus Dormibacterales bacterium]
MSRRSTTLPGQHGPDTKTSAHVSAGALRALHSAGFSPLGVVFGNASVHVAHPVTLGTKSRVTSFWRGFGGDSPEDIPPSIISAQSRGASGSGPEPFLASFPCPHGRGRVVRRTANHYTGFNFEVPGPGNSLGEAFVRALTRLLESAAQRGAHGVIDISVRVGGDPMLHGMVAITLTGTAVAHVSAPKSDRHFTTTVSAQGLVKLLGQGLFPTTIGFGAVLLAGWTGCGARVQLDSGYSTQVDQLGALMTQARELATKRVIAGCAGSDAVIEVHLTHAFHESTKSDYRVAAWASGSGTRRFAEPVPGPPATPVLTMEQR